ncbi:MAG: universal stress protein [Candidatus Sumerlaeota bacterium]
METRVEFETDLRPSQVQLKQILVPTDFSEPSQNALRYALRFAKEFGAQLTLLHVVEKTAIGAGRDIPGHMGYTDEQKTIAEKNLRALTASSEAAGAIKIASTLREGVPADEILAAAKDLDTDLIVIGTHGYKGWKRLLLGSAAQKVVRDAPCPVFIVREKEHEFI